MNKYQEAWDFIKINFYDEEWLESDAYSDYKKESFRLMQELVKKATPKKPIGRYTDYRCPVCGAKVRSGRKKDTVCRSCFQVLDWSEEE